MNRTDCEHLDAQDPLAALRDQFALPPNKIYLDGNSLGVLPHATAQRVAHVIQHEWGEHLIESWNTAHWIDLPQRLGNKLAKLVGAGANELVVADSTSVNLFKALSAALSMAQADAPLAPLTTIAGVLNMDMIGRNEEVQVGGGGRFTGFEVQTAESNANAVNMMGFARTPDLAAVVDRANQQVGLEIKKRYDNNPSNLVRRSDQWPFLQRGVPALGFMTGLHPDYHTVYDRPEKINYPKMEKIARLIHQASWDLANAAGRPAHAKENVR